MTHTIQWFKSIGYDVSDYEQNTTIEAKDGYFKITNNLNTNTNE